MKKNNIIFILTILYLAFPFAFLNAQVLALTANDDWAKTGPLQKVKVDVIVNDILTCDDYTIIISSSLDPNTQGIATVEGDYIVFTPGINCWGIVAVQYGLTCYGQTVTATLYIEVMSHNLPLNIVSKDALCIEDMPQNIPFGIKEKFRTSTTSISGITSNFQSGSGSMPTGSGNDDIGWWRVDGFTSPVVGDLNGDGKPEIVMIGVRGNTSGGARNDARSINIYNGQNGDRLYYHNFGTTYYQSNGTGYHRAPTMLALADLDKDGIGEIIYTRPDGKLIAYKPVFNGTNITSLGTMWESAVSFRAPIVGNGTNDVGGAFNVANPFIADINGDGIPEIIVYNKVYNGATGALLMSWQNAAGNTPKASNISVTGNSGTGLRDVISSSSTAQTDAGDIRNVAMTGRRPTSGNLSDENIAAPAVWDIDGDGIQEIITGNRIHKIQINSLTNHTLNTYTTIEGPLSVTLTENPNGTPTTHYLSDGFTRVADIDGDGFLDIIVVSACNNAQLDSKVLIYVWDPRFPNEVKAAITYWSDGANGSFGIPFIGDINGKEDGWDGTGYTRKLTEICLITGAAQIDRATNNGGRTGVKFHPLTDEKIRQGTASGSGMAAGWDNNQRSNSNRRFNRGYSGTSFAGHVIAFTYDGQETEVENRLKISWAIEHSDQSHSTSITLFDFDNNGAKDLCYKDETTLRVISPKRAGNDYVAISETAMTANSAIMFSTPVFGGTGVEYPVIADVNLDGSADILVTHSATNQDIGASCGIIRVFEYSGHKWAPSPPVWNQSYYNPLQINEDLTVPARPQSLLTEYLDENNDIITPFNGVWIQQPIVKEGNRYVPAVRMPDANIMDVKVVGALAAATVTLTIRNQGTASINAATPISFYLNDTLLGTVISTKPVGVDIFPNEKVVLNYTLTGDFREKLIWVRIIDDGNSFPATGYADCDLTNNAMAGIDCPGMQFTITAASTIICKNDSTLLSTTYITPQYASSVIYQWYRNEQIIPEATDYRYYAKEAGSYKLYLIDSLCRKFSNEITLTINALPVTPVIDPVVNVCANAALKFSVPGAYVAYEWRADNSAGTVAGSTPYILAHNAGIYTRVVRVQDENGCWSAYSAPASGTITASTASSPSVNVQAISTDYSSAPPTVTFSVSWSNGSRDCRHNAKVWLFVDHQPGGTGTWSRVSLNGTPVIVSGLSGGSITTVPGNDTGFWLHGLNGAYSATVTVPLAINGGGNFSWCVYASDYPPNAVENANGYYDLHGTPPFVVNGTPLAAEVLTFSGCISSLTGATGCPGDLPATPTLVSFTADPPTITSGESTVLRCVATGAAWYSYDHGVTWQPSAMRLVSPTVTTTYSVRVKNFGGCESSELTTTVTVN